MRHFGTKRGSARMVQICDGMRIAADGSDMRRNAERRKSGTSRRAIPASRARQQTNRRSANPSDRNERRIQHSRCCPPDRVGSAAAGAGRGSGTTARRPGTGRASGPARPRRPSAGRTNGAVRPRVWGSTGTGQVTSGVTLQRSGGIRVDPRFVKERRRSGVNVRRQPHQSAIRHPGRESAAGDDAGAIRSRS